MDNGGLVTTAEAASSNTIGDPRPTEIPFPPPGSPFPPASTRAKRGAAQAAAASILQSSTSNERYKDGSPTSSNQGSETAGEEAEGGAPSLTNGDSDYDDASSMIIDGRMGETDEYTMDEYEYSATGKYKDEMTDEDDLAIPQTTSKRKASSASPAKSKRTAKAAKVEGKNEVNDMNAIDYAATTAVEDADNAGDGEKPKRKAKSKAAKAVKQAIEAVLAKAEGGGEENGLLPRQSGGEESDLTDLDDAEKLEEKPKKQRKPRKPRAPKPEPVYVIPEVEKLPNDQGFNGRLGYACLNTILRKRKPPVFCSRTCRIDTIKKNGMEFLKELGRTNIIDLATLIQWNEDNVSFAVAFRNLAALFQSFFLRFSVIPERFG